MGKQTNTIGEFLGFALGIVLAQDWWAGNDEDRNHERVSQITNSHAYIHAYIYVCIYVPVWLILE